VPPENCFSRLKREVLSEQEVGRQWGYLTRNPITGARVHTWAPRLWIGCESNSQARYILKANLSLEPQNANLPEALPPDESPDRLIHLRGEARPSCPHQVEVSRATLTWQIQVLAHDWHPGRIHCREPETGLNSFGSFEYQGNSTALQSVGSRPPASARSGFATRLESGSNRIVEFKRRKYRTAAIDLAKLNRRKYFGSTSIACLILGRQLSVDNS
jgi:hypothetical protein